MKMTGRKEPVAWSALHGVGHHPDYAKSRKVGQKGNEENPTRGGVDLFWHIPLSYPR